MILQAGIMKVSHFLRGVKLDGNLIVVSGVAKLGDSQNAKPNEIPSASIAPGAPTFFLDVFFASLEDS